MYSGWVLVVSKVRPGSGGTIIDNVSYCWSEGSETPTLAPIDHVLFSKFELCVQVRQRFAKWERRRSHGSGLDCCKRIIRICAKSISLVL